MSLASDTTTEHQQQQQPFQGVLWKRRDVFQHRWRPRWFVLQPDGQLSYYLLTPRASTAWVATATTEPDVSDEDDEDEYNTTPRRRPHSHSSCVWNQPRGTLNVRNVEIIRAAERQDEWFVFTLHSIGSNNNRNDYHLAARSEATRTSWIHALQHYQQQQQTAAAAAVVCNPAASSNGRSSRSMHGVSGSNQNMESIPSTNRWAPVQYTTTTSSSNIPPKDSPRYRVPIQLQAQIDALLEQFVHNNNNNTNDMLQQEWKPLLGCDTNDTQSWWSRLVDATNNAPAVVVTKTTRSFSSRSMEHVFGHLWDYQQQQHNDNAVLHEYNPHTRLVQTTCEDYNDAAAWPLWTSKPSLYGNIQQQQQPMVVRQWQVLKNGTMVLVSVVPPCTHNDDNNDDTIQAPTAATLHFLSLWVVQPLDHSHGRVLVTHYLSLDWTGDDSNHSTRSRSVSNGLLTQRAMHDESWKWALTEPRNETNHKTTMQRWTNATLLDSLKQQQNRRRVTVDTNDKTRATATTWTPPSVVQQATVLLLPLFLYHGIQRYGFYVMGMALEVFIVAVFWSLRQLAWWHGVQGKPIQVVGNDSSASACTCRFTVPVKGLRRYLSNSYQERDELGLFARHEMIAWQHVVTRAVAKSLLQMQQEQQDDDNTVDNDNTKGSRLLVRECYHQPWLFLDKQFYEPVQTLVSVSRDGTFVTVPSDWSVTEMADAWSRLKQRQQQQSSGSMGHVVIHFSSSSCQQGQSPISMDASLGGQQSSVTPSVVVLVQQQTNLKNRDDALTLSITVSRPPTVDACHRFAFHVQTFLQFPEMCDDK